MFRLAVCAIQFDGDETVASATIWPCDAQTSSKPKPKRIANKTTTVTQHSLYGVKIPSLVALHDAVPMPLRYVVTFLLDCVFRVVPWSI